MGARELLQELAGAGFSIAAEGERLVIRPASKLTGELRAVLRDAKPELLALLAHPYRLTPEQGERCHAGGWDDGEIAAFEAREARLRRAGYSRDDAEDLAERLTLRDRGADERRMCIECAHYRTGRWGNYRVAGLHRPEVERDLAVLLQRCSGFDGVHKA